MPLQAIFLDIDGVIVHPGPDSARLSGDVYAEELGGDAIAWGRASSELGDEIWERFVATVVEVAGWDRALHIAQLRRLCEHLGVTPPGDDRCHEIGRRRDIYVAEHRSVAFPGTVSAIRELSARFALHTASAHSAYRIDALLRHLGVRQLFGLTVGPEIVGALKHRPGFYEALVRQAGVMPREALVVDDQPDALMEAVRVGTATVLIDATVSADGGRFDGVIASLAELPAFLERGLARR
jgi:HAD superfamily hydrolase (TIGR01509 family)